jgi:hypothetical protein
VSTRGIALFSQLISNSLPGLPPDTWNMQRHDGSTAKSAVQPFWGIQEAFRVRTPNAEFSSGGRMPTYLGVRGSYDIWKWECHTPFRGIGHHQFGCSDVQTPPFERAELTWVVSDACLDRWHSPPLPSQRTTSRRLSSTDTSSRVLSGRSNRTRGRSMTLVTQWYHGTGAPRLAQATPGRDTAVSR